MGNRGSNRSANGSDGAGIFTRDEAGLRSFDAHVRLDVAGRQRQ